MKRGRIWLSSERTSLDVISEDCEEARSGGLTLELGEKDHLRSLRTSFCLICDKVVRAATGKLLLAPVSTLLDRQ